MLYGNKSALLVFYAGHESCDVTLCPTLWTTGHAAGSIRKHEQIVSIPFCSSINMFVISDSVQPMPCELTDTDPIKRKVVISSKNNSKHVTDVKSLHVDLDVITHSRTRNVSQKYHGIIKKPTKWRKAILDNTDEDTSGTSSRDDKLKNQSSKVRHGAPAVGAARLFERSISTLGTISIGARLSAKTTMDDSKFKVSRTVCDSCDDVQINHSDGTIGRNIEKRIDLEDTKGQGDKRKLINKIRSPPVSQQSSEHFTSSSGKMQDKDVIEAKVVDGNDNAVCSNSNFKVETSNKSKNSNPEGRNKQTAKPTDICLDDDSPKYNCLKYDTSVAFSKLTPKNPISSGKQVEQHQGKKEHAKSDNGESQAETVSPQRKKSKKKDSIVTSRFGAENHWSLSEVYSRTILQNKTKLRQPVSCDGCDATNKDLNQNKRNVIKMRKESEFVPIVSQEEQADWNTDHYGLSFNNETEGKADQCNINTNKCNSVNSINSDSTFAESTQPQYLDNYQSDIDKEMVDTEDSKLEYNSAVHNASSSNGDHGQTMPNPHLSAIAELEDDCNEPIDDVIFTGNDISNCVILAQEDYVLGSTVEDHTTTRVCGSEVLPTAALKCQINTIPDILQGIVCPMQESECSVDPKCVHCSAGSFHTSRPDCSRQPCQRPYQDGAMFPHGNQFLSNRMHSPPLISRAAEIEVNFIISDQDYSPKKSCKYQLILLKIFVIISHCSSHKLII